MGFELFVWGDGTLRLSFWDSLHGHDAHFILSDDGMAYTEDENENRHPVDLVAELRRMAEHAGLFDAGSVY